MIGAGRGVGVLPAIFAVGALGTGRDDAGEMLWRVKEAIAVYAVVRYDDYLPGGPEVRVTVVALVPTQAEASAEVERLAQINARKACRYFWQHTRYYPRGEERVSHPSEGVDDGGGDSCFPIAAHTVTTTQCRGRPPFAPLPMTCAACRTVLVVGSRRPAAARRAPQKCEADVQATPKNRVRLFDHWQQTSDDARTAIELFLIRHGES